MLIAKKIAFTKLSLDFANLLLYLEVQLTQNIATFFKSLSFCAYYVVTQNNG